MSIVNECMIVNVRINMWLGYRHDKAASQALVAQAHAEADAARVNKHIIPKEALKDIVSAATAVRTHLYTKTMPWKDNGDRLLTRKLHFKFMEEHNDLVANFDSAVDSFLKNAYTQERERAAFRMGTLFNENDYPTVSELRRKFAIALDIDAVTTANDFRVQMDEKAREQVRQSMEAAMQDRVNRALGDVWTRLAEKLGHYAKTMSEEDKIFRDTTVTNLEEIVDMLPDLNIFGDKQLAQMGEEIREKLIGYTPEQLRKEPGTRAYVAEEAQNIMSVMGGYMKAFGGVQ